MNIVKRGFALDHFGFGLQEFVPSLQVVEDAYVDFVEEAGVAFQLGPRVPSLLFDLKSFGNQTELWIYGKAFGENFKILQLHLLLFLDENVHDDQKSENAFLDVEHWHRVEGQHLLRDQTDQFFYVDFSIHIVGIDGVQESLHKVFQRELQHAAHFA